MNTQYIYTVPPVQDSRKKTWRKRLTAVDRGQKTGYAFAGEFVHAGEQDEAPAGTLILCYDRPGSVKNWYPRVRVMRVDGPNKLTEIYQWEGATNQQSWALAVRDDIAALIQPAGDVSAGDKDDEKSAAYARVAEDLADVAEDVLEWFAKIDPFHGTHQAELADALKKALTEFRNA